MKISLIAMITVRARGGGGCCPTGPTAWSCDLRILFARAACDRGCVRPGVGWCRRGSTPTHESRCLPLGNLAPVLTLMGVRFPDTDRGSAWLAWHGTGDDILIRHERPA